MQASPDIWVYVLGAGVVVLFGLFFWHVFNSFIGAGRKVADYLDNSSARRRAALEREIRFGPDPLWLRAIRFMFIAAAVCLAAVLFWKRFRLQ